MTLLQFREKIETECDSLGSVKLPIKALKIDASTNQSLKHVLGCANLKSCDYLKKFNSSLYFIEISDFHYELHDYLKDGLEQKKAERKVKEGIRLKLSDSFLIYTEMLKFFNINDNRINGKKVLLVFCKTSISDVIAFSYLSNNLENHYRPTFCSSIKVVPYTELENILTK
jgi:hypothetical protein